MNFDSEPPDGTLHIEDVPAADASWSEISRFALTFDGYSYWGTFERCAEIGNAPLRSGESLIELRTRVFFEQRRWRHFGESPQGKDLDYMRGLIRSIREGLADADRPSK